MAKEKITDLEEWYKQESSKAITDNYKKRLNDEYNKRKASGQNAPEKWKLGNEEDNARMRKANPSYAQAQDNAKGRSKRAGESMTNVAEGVARGTAVATAVTGNKKEAIEMSKTANKLDKAGDKQKKERKQKAKEAKESKKSSVSTVEEPLNEEPLEKETPKSSNHESSKSSSSTSTEKADNDYTLEEIIRLNNNNIEEIQKWFDEHKDYIWGPKTKKWAKENGVVNNNDPLYNEKVTFDDYANSTSDAQDKEAYEDAQVYENVSDVLKGDKKKYNDMNDLTKVFWEEASNVDDSYKENIGRTLLGMYKNGELDGNTNDPEKNKQIARERLGYFILNGLGTSLINSSLVARGSSPSQESDIQKIRREKLEGALERYNKKRDEIMTKTIDQMGLNAELLNKFNMDTDMLKNNKIFEEVAKSRDRKNYERTLKAYKVAGDYLKGLSNDEKQNVFMAIMALNSNDGKSAAVSYLTATLGKDFINKIYDFLEDLGIFEGGGDDE